MHATKLTCLVQIGSHTLSDLPSHRIRVALQLLCPVLGQLGHRRLGRVPVACAILVEIGGGGGEPSQGIAEHGGWLSRHHASEPDSPVFNAPVGRSRDGRRAKVDGTGHAAAGGVLAQVGHLAVQTQRQRTRAVHVLVDDWHPVVGQVPRQFRLHVGVVDGEVARHDERVLVALFPKAVDHHRHQAQHPARSLELHQGGPVGVQPVEDLRVDRVGGLHPPLVVSVAALRRELLVLGAVHVEEGPRHRVPGHELVLLNQRLEQAAAHDLEALLGAGRPPGCLHAAHGVAQPIQCRPTALTSHLDIIGAGVRRSPRVGGRQADHQQAPLGQLGRLGERLGEGEVRLEAAAGRSAAS